MTFGVANPRLGDGDCRVGVDEVVAVKVDRQKSGDRPVGVFWDVDQQRGFRSFLLAGERNQHFTSNGFAAKSGVVVLGDL